MGKQREELLLEFVRCVVTCRSSQRPAELGAEEERLAVRHIRSLIGEHFAALITLSALASVANLSPFHLHHVFRKQSGMASACLLSLVTLSTQTECLLQAVALGNDHFLVK